MFNCCITATGMGNTDCQISMMDAMESSINPTLMRDASQSIIFFRPLNISDLSTKVR